jgi:catechol 2,3-dioxygenase-like lactoylglutathione lyase family enzyme
MALRIELVVLGVTDPERAAEFWCGALGYVRRPPRYADDWIVVEPPAGAPGAPLGLDVSESPAQEFPRIHLDLRIDHPDLAAEVERLVTLGAQRVDWQHYPTDPDPSESAYVVLADPEGNRFCVVAPPPR